ncbi:MAG: sugar phosphate isomerase/epimerase [Acidobacteria bacterium]|nr:sugar phosphate isomerase/epimerase [Acidobacteriota bacterium]
MSLARSLARRHFLAAALAPLLQAAPGQIRVGCQTRAYGSPLPDPETFLAALADLGQLGYEGFETNYRSLEASFMQPRPMRREFEKRGIEMMGLHFGAGFFDPTKILDEHKLIHRIAGAVREFGGGHIIVSGQQLPKGADGRAAPGALQSKATELNAAGETCRRFGVRLSFHNHRHELAHDAEEIRYLLRETDPRLVSLLLDVGHPFPAQWPVTRLVREYGSRIAGFHLRDTKAGDEVIFGTGKFDFAALGDVVRETGWRGWMIVEVNRRDDISSHDLADRCRKHVRETMKL